MNKNLTKKLENIKVLRETKGKENQTLKMIEAAKTAAAKQKEYEVFARVYWEESLNWQHYVMNEAAKKKPDMKKVEIQALKMLNAALNADRIINKYNLEHLIGVSHRFIGNSYRVNRMYDLAEIEFQEAIRVFKDQKHKIPQHLEVQGFLASVYVFQGKITKGVSLAKQTFEQFINDKDAKKLKESDFTTWVIWVTGIFPRLADALKSTNSKFDNDLILKYLEKSRELLKNPDNYPVWGEDMFKYRFDELRKAKNILRNLAVIIVGLVGIYN